MSDEEVAEPPPPPPRPEFSIQTVCECQATLHAELGADRLIMRGWARRRGQEESAPANTVGKPEERFDVVWQCPMCGRNTLRTFHEGALTRLAG